MQKNIRRNFTLLTEQMAKKGIKLRTWCKAKKLSNADYTILLNMSLGKTKGIRGRAKELREILEKDGFEVA